MSQYAEGMSYDDADDGAILTDAPCRRCSYNLRGLQKSGRCPECGTPAGLSVFGDLLRYSHPRWLYRVAEGLEMVLWGIVVTVIANLAAATLFRSAPAVGQFVTMMGLLIGAWGTWQMSSPDPSGVGESGGVNARQLVRAAVIASLAASVVRLMVTLTGASLGGAIAIVLFQIVCGVIGIIGEFAKLQYIERLAGRIPDEALSSRANSLKWGLAVCYALMVICGAIAAVAMAAALAGSGRGMPGGAGVGLLMTAGCLLLPVVIALLIVSVMTIILIYRMRVAVRQQASLSAQIWSRGGKPAPTPSAAEMRPRF